MDYQSIIKEYKTPFYLYDISELKSRVDMMKRHLPDIGLCYAMKASPILAGFITDYVDRLEVCSPGEYEICIRDGISPDKLLVSGVNKTRESINRILELGGAEGLFTIESPEHFEILEECYKGYIELIEKFDSLDEVPEKMGCYIRLTSGNQFGVDKATLEDLCEIVINSKYLKLVGIHYFSGTQKSMKKIEKELTMLAEYGPELAEKLGVSEGLSLEYGPGIGIDYFRKSDDEGAVLESLAERITENEQEMVDLAELVEKTGIRNSFSDITFEYGRYRASTCGKYITEIADVKLSDGTNYAILEGGLHQIVYYSSMAGMKVPFVEYIAGDKTKDIGEEASRVSSGAEVNEIEDGDRRDYVLAGSLCSVNDILVRKISLPKLDIGDALCFNLAGAYSATEGMALFLSRDLPAILVKDIDENIQMVRDHIEMNVYNGQSVFD